MRKFLKFGLRSQNPPNPFDKGKAGERWRFFPFGKGGGGIWFHLGWRSSP
jgi:hypothetical protein